MQKYGKNRWDGGSSPTGTLKADYYQPMTDGNDDDLLTPLIMEAGDIVRLEDPTLDMFWTIPNDGVFVSTSLLDTTLPVPVDVDGTEHVIDSGKSWKWRDDTAAKLVTLTIEKFFAVQNFNQMTIGFYFKLGMGPTGAESVHDICIINGSLGDEFSVAQVQGAAGSLTMNVHSFAGLDGGDIPVTSGRRYWGNLLFDGTGGVGKFSIFDPALNFAEIADSPSTTTIVTGKKTQVISFCATDGHARVAATTFSAVAQPMIGLDSTAPILPGSSSGRERWA